MFKRIVRKDGSVIILLPKADTKAVTFEVLYKVGSRQEGKNINGVSHFVEHLMFKGTPKRPNTADIAKELDGVGAEYNAFTGKDHTGYYITADASHLAMSVEVLSDMLHNSKFDPVEIDRERGVIIEEIKMYEDNPLMYIEDVFEQLIYRGTPLGMDIAGPIKNIQNISRKALFDYHKKYYYNGNTVFGVAGKFSQKQALVLINKHFPLEKKRARAQVSKVKSIAQSSPLVLLKTKKMEQVQLALGFRSISSIDPKYLLNRVTANILGGNMSSRLFIEIRERLGLCYSIRAGIHGYEDISSFRVQAGLNKERIAEALLAIKKELNKMRDKGVSKAELVQSKENLKGKMILWLENASTHLSFLSSQEILGTKIKDMDTVLKEIKNVSQNSVNAAIRKIINWKQCNLAIVGPFSEAEKFRKLLIK